MGKIKHGLQTGIDGVYLWTAEVAVSGVGGDMTGSLIKYSDGNFKSTDGQFTVQFGSGSLRDVANQPLPTGSMRFVLANPAMAVMTWGVSTECSGVFANQAYDPTGGAAAYRIQKYGHVATVSGTTTFDVGFGHFSGSTTNGGFDNFVPAVPADKARPNSMAARVSIWAWLRKTNRSV